MARSKQAPGSPGFNDNENPLLRLYLRKGKGGETYIDAQQLAAGERLRADFERAMLAPSVTFSYNEPVSRSGPQSQSNQVERLSDGALMARDRVHEALQAVGPELSGILYDVVCLAAGLEHAERRLNIPVRSGKVVLSLALTRLARHYGLKRDPKPEAGSTPAVWHLPDYRPSIPRAAAE
jgi:hypothetical protein